MRCPICKTSLKDEEMYVCDKCKKLPQQLAEKDKEIKKLKCLLLDKENKATFWEQIYNQTIEDNKILKNCGSFTALNKIIRKQVCDKIRVKFNEYIKIFFCFNPSTVDFINLNIDEVREFLDKIEQGE